MRSWYEPTLRNPRVLHVLIQIVCLRWKVTSTMKLSSITILALAGTIISAAQSSRTTPGYFTDFTTLPNDTSFSFGKNYAVLNIDLIVGIVSGLNSTCEGQKFIDSISTWIDAVHAQSPPPLTIFTWIFFSNSANPEIGPSTPFRTPSAAPGDAASPATMLYPAFVPEGNDLVLQKMRYYAGGCDHFGTCFGLFG